MENRTRRTFEEVQIKINRNVFLKNLLNFAEISDRQSSLKPALQKGARKIVLHDLIHKHRVWKFNMLNFEVFLLKLLLVRHFYR